MVSDLTYNGTATQNVHYDYDEYGARTLMQEKNPSSGTVESSTSYAYNSFEQLQTETRSFKGLTGTYSVGYQYNLAGGVKTMTYTANSFVKNVNYAYNNVGGLSGIGTNLRAGGAANDTTNVMSGFLYRGFGAVKQVNYGNGKQMTANYDAKRLQMTYMSVHTATNVNDKIVSLDYNYYNGGSNNGRIQKITDYLDAAYTTTYGYDDQNRLSSASATAVTRSYSYDPWANLLTTSGTGPNEWGYTPTTNYSYTLNYATNASGAPATNRLSNQFQYYDNAGNMTVDLNGQVYSYDAANRIKSITNNKYMEYDGDGHRVLSDESAIGNTKFWYLWSSVLNQPIVELGSSGNVFRAYVYSPGGGLVAQQSFDGAFLWMHQDHLGSGHKMTDSTGAVVYTERFDPHGQSVLRISNNGPLYNSHKFTGYERDYGTNTDNAKARQYHHNNGRFMQSDPLSLGASDLSNPQSLNLYSYANNDPVNFVDPDGLNAQMCFALVDWTLWETGGITINSVHIFCFGGGGGGSGGGDGGGGGNDGDGNGATQDLAGKPDIICPMDAASIMKDKTFLAAQEKAWTDSKSGTKGFHEEGGWVYQNLKTGVLSIQRATTKGSGDSLDLNNPPNVKGSILIANFHTHPSRPGMGDKQPASRDDERLELFRNVPGIIRNSDGLSAYGPNRRGTSSNSMPTSLDQVKGYPGSTVDNTKNSKCGAKK